MSDQADAAAMIAEVGQAVTLTPKASTYDPATATVSGTTTPVSTTGVVLPLSRGLMNMAGTTIQAGDQQLLLPGTIAQPAVGTAANVNGQDYTIVQVNPLDPAGTALLYDCVIRK